MKTFDLEKRILEWRQQMLAAGIKTPVPLEELEAHLREGIERLMESGLSESQAFEEAVLRVGNGAELKKEFTKVKGLVALFGDNKSTRAERILGALWFVFCLASLVLLFRVSTTKFAAGPLLLAIYGTGLFGSILLIRGAPMGRKIIRTIAAGFVAISLFLCWNELQHWSVTSTVFTSFYSITALLLSLPSLSKPKPANK